MDKKTLLIITACIFFVLGIGAGYIIFSQKKLSNVVITSPASDYYNGWKELENRVRESGRCEISDSEIRVLSGEVLEQNNNYLTMKIVLFDPFSEPSLDERQVSFDSSTSIIKKAVKSEEKYKEEMDEYNKNHSVENDGENYYLNMPRKGFEENIAFSDIKKGDEILVKSNVDIRDSKQVLAQSIEIR